MIHGRKMQRRKIFSILIIHKTIKFNRPSNMTRLEIDAMKLAPFRNVVGEKDNNS